MIEEQPPPEPRIDIYLKVQDHDGQPRCLRTPVNTVEDQRLAWTSLQRMMANGHGTFTHEGPTVGVSIAASAIAYVEAVPKLPDIEQPTETDQT